MLCTSKESLEHVEFRFTCKKLDFFEKNQSFFNFWIFFPKGGPFGVEMVKFFFSTFQNFITLFSKIASLGPNRY